VLFYLACGVAANLTQVFVDPTSTIAAIGASGAIAGVLGAYAITFPGASVSVILPIFLFFWVIDVPALIMIGVWFVSQFFSGVASLADTSAPAGGVAWWAHVGGFLFGILLMLILPKAPVVPRDAGSVSFDRRARADTGLIGLAIGTVSLVSELLQIAILARAVVVFLGVRAMAELIPATLELVRLTNPLVAPFAQVVPALRISGHFVELYSIVAIAVFYLLGAALSWIIAALAYEPRRRYARRWPGRSGVGGF
jgi:hypothetical protein